MRAREGIMPKHVSSGFVAMLTAHARQNRLLLSIMSGVLQEIQGML
jgi:hypothetical protein